MLRLALSAVLLLLSVECRAAEDEPSFVDLRQAAAAGDAEAQLALARRFATGSLDAPRDALLAEQWMLLAAQSGLPRAQVALAEALLAGEVLRYDPMAAADWLRRAMAAGSPRATVLLGRLHLRGEGVPQNQAEASRLFRTAADAGDPAGRTALAEMLRSGAAGIDRNSAEGMQLLRTAAAQGYPPALYLLALAHFNGVDAPLDLPLAAQLMTQAADRGYPEALLTIGRYYLEGQGVPKDPVRAYMYFALAEELGGSAIRDPASLQIRALDLKMPATAVAEARKKAKEWRQLRGL